MMVARKSSNTRPVVGLVMKSLAAEFFQTMQAAAIRHAERRGDLELIPVGTQTQTEVDHQIALVDELIARKVDAMVVIPIDSQALVDPVVRAVKAGIKVVNADVMLDRDQMAQYGIELPFVGPDHTLAAKVVGDMLANELGPGGRVAIIEGIPSALNAQQRKAGFLDSIQQNELELVACETGQWETGYTREVFARMLQAHPDIQGVLCANDAMALGVMQVLDAAHQTKHIRTVGIDNVISIHPYIRSGTMLASIDLLSSKMVATAIDYALDALLGKERRGWIKTPVQVITRETLTELSF